MDAWATISHYLDYKTDKDVPSDLRKDFYALSGLFYVADTHFEMFYESRIKSKESSEKQITNSNTTAIELNLDTFIAYVNRKIKDRKTSSVESFSILLNELLDAGYTTIEALDVQINRGMNAFLEYEKENPPDSSDGKFADIGVIRILMTILDDNYYNIRQNKPTTNQEYLKYKSFVKK